MKKTIFISIFCIFVQFGIYSQASDKAGIGFELGGFYNTVTVPYGEYSGGDLGFWFQMNMSLKKRIRLGMSFTSTRIYDPNEYFISSGWNNINHTLVIKSDKQISGDVSIQYKILKKRFQPQIGLGLGLTYHSFDEQGNEEYVAVEKISLNSTVSLGFYFYVFPKLAIFAKAHQRYNFLNISSVYTFYSTGLFINFTN